jgi:hypothetical protein
MVTESHSHEASADGLYPAPIFILGMRPRTGTHFLANLLCQHPECVKSPIAEDSFLINANLLARYVTRTNDEWTVVNGAQLAGYDELLRQCIGEGLLLFLRQIQLRGEEERASKFGKHAVTSGLDRRMVTKTPHLNNLEFFFQFFPRAHLLLLVRDGRAVVESNVRSFASDPEDEMRAWAAAADQLAQFEAEHRDVGPRCLIVRFEDLHSRTEAEMRRILTFLGLRTEDYNFEAALHLPVVGSSTFKRPPGKVSWLPVRKTADFDPLGRASEWTRATNERFDTLAGKQLMRLGYSQALDAGNDRAEDLKS